MYIWDDIYLKETCQTYAQIYILQPFTYYFKNTKVFYYTNRQTGGNSKQTNLFFFKESFSEMERKEKHAWFAWVRFVLSFLLCTICASTDCAGCENAGEWAESCLIVILQYPPQGISWLWHSCYTQGHFGTHLKLTLLLRWCIGNCCTVKTTSVLVTLCGGYCWAL